MELNDESACVYFEMTMNTFAVCLVLFLNSIYFSPIFFENGNRQFDIIEKDFMLSKTIAVKCLNLQERQKKTKTNLVNEAPKLVSIGWIYTACNVNL